MPQNIDEPQTKSSFPVVGIGASAGGVRTLQEFFKQLPADTGMAFVIIMHLSRDHASNLPEILAKQTDMPVRSALESDILEPNQVVVIPANCTLTIKKRTFILSEREVAPGKFRPVDDFFESLADQYTDLAIGVILSGTGFDGTLGIKAIKANGGITFAQSEESAKFADMPHNAILSGQVDLVLSPPEIADKLAELGRHPHLKNLRLLIEDQKQAGWEKIQRLVQSTGVDFSKYKQSTVRRRISRRMALHQIDNSETYANFLSSNPQEIKFLYEDILIKVTKFFRDPETFDALVEQVFPRILKDSKSSQTIRIWVPGCASGEEVYSLAMLLSEYLETHGLNLATQIFGTDVSEIAIKKARKGFYPQGLVADLSQTRLHKFFTPSEDGYQIKKHLREMCIFAHQDFISDPPFSRLDLISCRNVMIYLDADLQNKAFALFHYALKPEGFLLLGSSESIGRAELFFSSLDKKHRIYQRKRTKHKMPAEWTSPLPKPSVTAENYSSTGLQPLKSDERSLKQEIDQFLLQKLDPVAVLVDSNFNVVQFRGNCDPFIKHRPGKATLNLLKITHDSLQIELSTLLKRAQKQLVAQQSDYHYMEGDEERRLFIEVSPLTIDESHYFLVQFTPKTLLNQSCSKGNSAGYTPDSALQKENVRLKKELLTSQEFAQQSIEEKDEALEDLKAANEEILSSNEELQSINEELETAKEELESGNEELTTVNQELLSRNEELTQTHNDLRNLILSVQIPFLIVDNQLKIRLASYDAEETLMVTPGDVGRTLSELSLSFSFPEMEKAMLDAIRFGHQTEQEIKDRKGRWNLLRIRPYRTEKNSEIKGAVLALLDIDQLKQSMEETERAYHYSLSIIDTIKDPLLVLDEELRITKANPAFYQKFKISPKQTEGYEIFKLDGDQWDNPELRQLLLEILPESAQIDNFPLELDFPQLGPRHLLISARELKTDVSRQTAILLDIQDTTDQKQVEIYLRQAKQAAEEGSRVKGEFLANMSHEIRTPLTVILGAMEYLQEAPLNEDLTHCLKLAEKAGKSLLDLIGDILDISKIEAKRLVLEVQPFNLRECVEETVLIMRASAKEKELELDLEMAGQMPEVLRGDEIRLRQVLTNLIGNAIKFSDQGGIRVKVEMQFTQNGLENHDQKLLFSISDNGPGIPAEKMGHLFRSFSQIDASINRNHGGSGLGLAICKGIVERIGGEIWAESKHGFGSTFFFTLPFQSERRQKSRSVVEISEVDDLSDPVHNRILLVEDEPDVQEMMRLLLSGKEWDLKIVADGQEAIGAWEEKEFDLILMDLHMKGMDGLTATRQIRDREAEGQHIPIIGLTANALPKAQKECLLAGMDEVLIKPLQIETLRAIIKDHRN